MSVLARRQDACDSRLDARLVELGTRLEGLERSRSVSEESLCFDRIEAVSAKVSGTYSLAVLTFSSLRTKSSILLPSNLLSTSQDRIKSLLNVAHLYGMTSLCGGR